MIRVLVVVRSHKNCLMKKVLMIISTSILIEKELSHVYTLSLSETMVLLKTSMHSVVKQQNKSVHNQDWFPADC